MTRNYFEGLLPEGFSRRVVANWARVDNNSYQKLSDADVKALAAEGATKSTELLMETHLSLAGASGKVGLYLKDGEWYKPLGMVMGIPASEKYERNDLGYLNKMFELIVANSTNPLEDQYKLWDLVVFNYLVGNTDCHIKNYSLLYSDDLRKVRLAPAYDIVCTRAYSGPAEMSFFIFGEELGSQNYLQLMHETRPNM